MDGEEFCLGSTSPADFFVPPCDGPIGAWVAVMSFVVCVRLMLLANTLRYWLARRARQLHFDFHGGNAAKLDRARRRMPVVAIVLVMETAGYAAALGVPFWIADPASRDSVVLALMGVITVLFFFVGTVSLNHFIRAFASSAQRH